MCVGSEFQVDGAETENAREEMKLLVMPVGLARRFVLEERCDSQRCHSDVRRQSPQRLHWRLRNLYPTSVFHRRMKRR